MHTVHIMQCISRAEACIKLCAACAWAARVYISKPRLQAIKGPALRVCTAVCAHPSTKSREA